MISIRDKIEYQQELAGWKSLIISAKMAIDKVVPESQRTEETEKLRNSWEGIKIMLKKVYE